MPGEDFKKTTDPEIRAAKREIALKNLQKAYKVVKERRQLRYDALAQFAAMNPFATAKEACNALGIQGSAREKAMVNTVLSQPAMQEKIKAYKQEFINPIVSADIGERYRTLAIQAVEKAQERLYSKDCKDNTLVEILRVCSQYLAPKNAAVQINAGAGSLVGVLSELQSSAQEALSKPPEKLIGPSSD